MKDKLFRLQKNLVTRRDFIAFECRAAKQLRGGVGGRVKIGGYRYIDLLHKNFRYGLDISENDVIMTSSNFQQFPICPKMDI